MMKLPEISIRLHGSLLPSKCVEMAVAAEAASFASLWFAENAFARGILPSAAACAVATKRIRIGAGVFNPYSRHPTMMAMEIGALDELSGGRAMLCIGAGIGSAVRKIGFNSDRPLIALRDTLAIVGPLLCGEEVDHQGTAFTAREVKLDYKIDGHIPILVAGRGDLTLKLSGRSADGLLISNMCSIAFARRSAARVEENRLAAARPHPARIVQYMPCAVRRSRSDALRAAKRSIGEMLPGFWTLGKKVQSAKDALLMGSRISEQEFEHAASRIAMGEDAGALLDDRFSDAFSLAGTPDECIRRAAEYATAGVTELALTFDGPTAMSDIRLLGEALQAAAR